MPRKKEKILFGSTKFSADPSSDLRPMLMHEKGHKTHFHVRYYNPVAQETGRRIYKLLVKRKAIKAPSYVTSYKAKRGDNLRKIAKRYKTSVDAIKKKNRLKSSRIYAGRTYRIPRKGGGVSVPRKLALPARRLPNGNTAQASFSAASNTGMGVQRRAP